MPASDNPFGLKPAPKFADLNEPMKLIDEAHSARMADLMKQVNAATSLTPRLDSLQAAWTTEMERIFKPVPTKDFLGPTFQKLADLNANTMLQLRLRIEEMHRPLKLSVEQMARSFTVPTGMAFAVLSEETTRQMQAAFRAPALSESFRETLSKVHKEFNVPSDIKRLIAELAEVAREAGELPGDDLETVDDVQREQAAHKFEALVQETAEERTAAAQFDRIIEAIRANRDPIQQKLLWFILVPMLMALLFSLLNPVMDFYVKKRLEEASSRQEANKVVKQQVREAVPDLRMLVDYRFVSMPTGKVLVVRASAGARAPRVGELRTGQVVHVVERSDAFTLVEWRSEDGTAAVRGWVFARYLERFR